MSIKESPPFLPAYGKTNGQPGLILPGYGMPSRFANITILAGRLYALRFMPSRNMNLAAVKFFVVTAAGSNDTCDVGIADSTGSVLQTAGGAVAGKLNATSASLTTWVSVSLSSALAVQAGLVYYALFSSVTPFGGSSAVLAGPDTGTNPFGDPFGTAIGTREVGIQTAVGATIGGSITLALGAAVPFLIVSES